MNHSTNTKGTNADHALWVGDLSADVDDYGLYKCFAARYNTIQLAKGTVTIYLSIIRCFLNYYFCVFKTVVRSTNGESRGYAFVNFTSETDYKDALTHMQGHRGLGSNPLRVSLAIPRNYNMIPGSSSTNSSTTSSLTASLASTIVQAAAAQNQAQSQTGTQAQTPCHNPRVNPGDGVLQDTRFVKPRRRAIPSCSDSPFNQNKAVFNQDHFMVFYKTCILSNQDQERFRCDTIPRSTKTKQCSTKTKTCAASPFSDSAFCFSMDVVNRMPFYLLMDVVNSVTFSKETRAFHGVLQDMCFVKPRQREIPSCSDSAFDQDKAVFNQDQDVCSDGVFRFRIQPIPSNVLCGQERHREKKQKT